MRRAHRLMLSSVMSIALSAVCICIPQTIADGSSRIRETHSVVQDVIVPCGPLFFGLHSLHMTNEHKACLDEVAIDLQQYVGASLVIDGHRDATERVGMGATRASLARDYLVQERGFDRSRISVRDCAFSCPHEAQDSALNRRAEIYLLPAGTTANKIVTKCANGKTSNPQITGEKVIPWPWKCPAWGDECGKQGPPANAFKPAQQSSSERKPR